MKEMGKKYNFEVKDKEIKDIIKGDSSGIPMSNRIFRSGRYPEKKLEPNDTIFDIKDLNTIYIRGRKVDIRDCIIDQLNVIDLNCLILKMNSIKK